MTVDIGKMWSFSTPFSKPLGNKSHNYCQVQRTWPGAALLSDTALEMTKSTHLLLGLLVTPCGQPLAASGDSLATKL